MCTNAINPIATFNNQAVSNTASMPVSSSSNPFIGIILLAIALMPEPVTNMLGAVDTWEVLDHVRIIIGILAGVVFLLTQRKKGVALWKDARRGLKSRRGDSKSDNDLKE